MIKVKEIRQLSFTSGAFFAPKISIEHKEGKLYYVYNQFGSSMKRYEERVYEKNMLVSEQSIIDFLVDCDAANVQEWSKNTYRDDDLLDAMGWGINIDVDLEKDGEVFLYEVNAEGYGVFPKTYEAFMKTIEKLIHESIHSWTYNAEIFKNFMEDETKGEEKRKILFKKITPMVLEIIEKDINIDVLDYDVREILLKYMQQAQYFAEEREDMIIFNYFIETHLGEENDEILQLSDYFVSKLIHSFALRGVELFEDEVAVAEGHQ